MTHPQRVSSFFTIVEERRRKIVKSIRAELGLAKDLTRLFEDQAAEFLGPEVERVSFDPRFKADDDHIFEIKGFSLPEAIEEAAKSPDGVDPFLLSTSEPVNLRAVFATSYDPASGAITVLIQRSNRARVLKAGWSLFVSGDTFRKLDEPGLTLDSKLVAVFAAENLLFRNFQAVNPLLDIKDYFVEATAEEVRAVFKHTLFRDDDADGLSELCDMTMRKRIAYIKASGILDIVTPRKICSSLKAIFGDFDISYTTRGGTEKLRLPKTKKDLKRLLNHLCEAYYIGDLTGEKYEANSHRRVTM